MKKIISVVLLTSQAVFCSSPYEKNNALLDAVRKCHSAEKDQVNQALLAGADADARNESGDTALHMALRNKCSDSVLKDLLTYGASVYKKNYYDEKTVMHVAAQKSDPQTLQLLVAQGASLHERDKKGHNPADLALLACNHAALKFLKNSGAKPTIAQTVEAFKQLAVCSSVEEKEALHKILFS